MYLIDFIHIDGTPTEVAEIKAICIKHKSLFKNELGPEPARIPPFDFKKLDIPQWKHFRNRGAPRVASTMRQYVSGLWSEIYTVQPELLIVLQRKIVSIHQCSGVNGSNVC